MREHQCLFSFLFFRFQSFLYWERERERVYNIGYKKKRSQSLLIFSFFRRSSCGEYFLFYGLIDFMLFLVLAWRNGSFVSEIFFCLLLPGVLGFGSVCHEPCPTTDFLIIYFRWQEGVPTSVLGSQPIIWLLSSSPLARRSVRATICHPVSHSFSLRSPSTNICFSILTWICYFGIDPHSYDVLTVILWWLATVNSNPRIVVILFLSSQWDTSWHYIYVYIRYTWFGLVGFYGRSTIVGYLMPNPVYTYTLNIYDL